MPSEVKIINDPTTIIHNITETVYEMSEEASKTLDSLLETDFINPTDPDEWHAVSPEHDARYDALEEAWELLFRATARLNAATNHSINIDNK